MKQPHTSGKWYQTMRIADLAHEVPFVTDGDWQDIEDEGGPSEFHGLSIEDLEARWAESLADIHHLVLLDHVGTCSIEWCGESWRGLDGKARVPAMVYVTSFMEPGGLVEVVLPVGRPSQRTAQDDPYAYVEWPPLREKTPRLYKRLEHFGLFKSINQTGKCAKGASCPTCSGGGRHKPTRTVVLGRLVLAASGVLVFGMEADHLDSASGDKFGGFDTLDNRREVLQMLFPREQRRKPRIWKGRTGGATAADG